MNYPFHIAKLLRAVHFGGNWTVSSFKEHLADVTWQESITKVEDFNTIAVLVAHTNYYVGIMLNVLQNQPLSGKDSESFAHAPINGPEDWEQLQNKFFSEAEQLAVLIEQVPESKLDELFFAEKYGNYYRNFHGIIEHCHYHLGQLVWLKKMLRRGV